MQTGQGTLARPMQKGKAMDTGFSTTRMVEWLTKVNGFMGISMVKADC